MKIKFIAEIKPGEWVVIVIAVVIFILFINGNYKTAIELIKILSKG
jgi:hypothetical protein